MTLLAEYFGAQHAEEAARLRRVLALRAMVVAGMSQREIAAELGVSQPAVSQQLKAAQKIGMVHPELLLEAAAPILRAVAEGYGFTKLAVFGSVARREARVDSDIDLLVQQPPGTSVTGLLRMQKVFEDVLGRSTDLITYGALKPFIDDDIRREAVLL